MTDLLARLKGVEPSGDGWTARCPAHEDRHNSLSVHHRDGRWLVKCHAGCNWRAITDALGMDAADLFDDEERGGGRFHPSDNRARAAPCQTQDNREPSLSISDGDHGKVLVRCHAGSERERVIAALRSRGLWTGYDTARELCGPTVHLPDQCKCGDNHPTIGEDRGPHRASLRCPVVCIAAGRSATTYNSIATIVQKFGCATTPIRIRRGAQTECASVVSPTPHVMERKENRHARKIDMRKHEAYPSTYYNAKDVIDGPILLTIDSVQFEPVGDGTSKKDKPVARFKEEDSKLLVVSATKWDAIALIAKSDDTEGWGGVKIVLEAGKATYQGKLVDSINVRGPKQKGPPKPVVVADDELNDEIPY